MRRSTAQRSALEAKGETNAPEVEWVNDWSSEAANGSGRAWPLSRWRAPLFPAEAAAGVTDTGVEI